MNQQKACTEERSMSITRDDLKRMTPEAISKALHAGELSHLTTGDTTRTHDADDAPANDGQVMVRREQLATMTPEDVSAAYHADRIEGLSR